MASYPVFSGDMAALNQGFAAQEDAAIRARAANQNYLAALTGQYQQARTARGAQEAALRQAEMANATQREQIRSSQGLGMRGLDVQESLGTRGLDLQSRDQNARNAAALLALSNQQTRDLATIDNEGRRLSILASQGDRQAQLEADRLAVMREQIQAQSTMTQQQLRSAEKIAAISSGRLPPNVAIQTMRINEDIQAQNDLAAATAAKAQEGVTVDTSWPMQSDNSLKIEDVLSRAKDAWSGMTAEQRMLVNYNPKATDPTKVFTAKTRPLLPTSGPQYTDADLRDQPGQGTGSTVLDILNFAFRNFDRSGKWSPAGSPPAPGAAPGAPADGKPGSGTGPISWKALIGNPDAQLTNPPPASITNPPPASITNQAPASMTNQAPASMTNQLAAVEGLPAVDGVAGYADQGPSWSMGGQPGPRGYLSGLTVGQQATNQPAAQVYTAPAEAAVEQPYDIQGPPQRMYNPRFRVPIGASREPNFNPAVGDYFAPDGSAFRSPLFRLPQQAQDAKATFDNPYDIQGPPQRMYNPRFSVPIGASADPNFNPAVGDYFSPDGSTFRSPLFKLPRQQAVQPVSQSFAQAPTNYLPSLQLLTQQAQQATTNTYNPNRRY